MTVGEKIQKRRKELGLSQEALAQKLLVSRQTVSQWETDQTVPTIDNLSRLKDVFGISVDEILSTEDTAPQQGRQPLETYRLYFTEAEAKEIKRQERKHVLLRRIPLVLLCFLIPVYLIATGASGTQVGFLIGIMFVCAALCIRLLFAAEKTLKGNYERCVGATYVFDLYEDFLELHKYRGDELLLRERCNYAEIERIVPLGNWLILRRGLQAYRLRKSDLKEDSVLFSRVSRPPLRNDAASKKKKRISIILFIASLLSVEFALVLFAVLSETNRTVDHALWVFYLMTPLPIASLVFGIAVKSNGRRFIKNIIVGIIMTVCLCIFGSFFFLFTDQVDHGNAPVVRVEQTLGIDIPVYERINTDDWSTGKQSVSRGHVYWDSDVFFSDAEANEFERQLAADGRWMSSMPSELIGVTTTLYDIRQFDYVLIYNEDTGECNALPDASGTYRFLGLQYNSEVHCLSIVEYDIDFVK